MEYLTRVLGIHVQYLEDAAAPLPGYLQTRYRVQRVALDGKPAVFLYPKTEPEPVDTVKKHIDRISRAENAPVVLVLGQLSFRQREYLLRDRIPFIVDGKQIYLPFLAVYLQERYSAKEPASVTLLPSAQLLLLHFIYQGCADLQTVDAANRLELTPTSISRASRQLEELGMLRAEKRGVQKVLFSDQTPEALFTQAATHFVNPVRRTVYVQKTELREPLPRGGLSALAEYTMLNPPTVETFASGKATGWDRIAARRLQSSEDQAAVELWRYNPKKLSAGPCVDRLSLAIALRDDPDERIEAAVEEMLTALWREIDGQRN